MGSLLQDSSVVASRATLLARQGRYHEAYALAKSFVDRDLYDTRLLPVYLSIAVKLKKRNDVFVLGHKLMEKRPEDAESWYAAGCYYYLTEQYSSARNFFGKATSLNKMFFPAWIGFAHILRVHGRDRSGHGRLPHGLSVVPGAASAGHRHGAGVCSDEQPGARAKAVQYGVPEESTRPVAATGGWSDVPTATRGMARR